MKVDTIIPFKDIIAINLPMLKHYYIFPILAKPL